MYVSCEPCMMCMGAILYEELKKIVYAATLQDSNDNYCPEMITNIDELAKYSKNKKTIASPGQTSPPGKTPLSSVKNCTPGGRKCQFPFLTKVNVRIWCASVRRIEMHKGCFDGKDAFGVVTEI